jgi:hypothetical protein
VGINAVTRLSLNLQRFNEHTDKYLTHNFKIVPNLEEIDLSEVVTSDSLKTSSDIVVVFNEWNKNNKDSFGFEEDLRDEIIEEAEKNLKESRDKLLTED